ncbi:uncharacterized protein SEPMUDRAFT_120693 [Sphaerulina musiva SO2202]|uniref:Uncharacterized protein n=1 Tax=Sphaerulina musiva (strain SO2202) TaxID=692275 RepID=M3CXF8_SPHMS|nr:uncharacterized protein SEPMUDRAFT_120693 [Sphaerulina musiva SO2202]EMF08792.1 hypothetical protein SEPMUDRAFT_120693 [Sphaerulina musiva SO2202]
MFTVNNASGNCGSKWEDGDAAYPYLCHAYLIQPSAAIRMVHRKRNSATSNRTSLVAPPLRSLHLHTVHMPRSPRESAKAHTLYNLVSTFAMLPSETDRESPPLTAVGAGRFLESEHISSLPVSTGQARPHPPRAADAVHAARTILPRDGQPSRHARFDAAIRSARHAGREIRPNVRHAGHVAGSEHLESAALHSISTRAIEDPEP